MASNLDHGQDIERAMMLGATDYIIKSNTKIDDVIKRIIQLTK